MAVAFAVLGGAPPPLPWRGHAQLYRRVTILYLSLELAAAFASRFAGAGGAFLKAAGQCECHAADATGRPRAPPRGP
jgi:hypothetical protein